MQEVGSVRPRNNHREVLPSDATVIESTLSYDLMESKRHNSVMLKTTSYHAGVLYLSFEDLSRLMRRLDPGRPAVPPPDDP